MLLMIGTLSPLLPGVWSGQLSDWVRSEAPTEVDSGVS